MAYLETALEALNKKDIPKAKEYLESAVKFGSAEEKEQARKILSEKGFALADVPSLLKEKRYAEALHVLDARERLRISSPEDFYYLGLLHDDFGMGMPNDKNKAREYYREALARRYAAGCVYIVMDWDGAEPLTEKQKKVLEYGDSVARTILAMEEFKNESAEEDCDDDDYDEDYVITAEDSFITTLNGIIEEYEECGFAKFILSRYQLLSMSSEERFVGFQTLQTLKDHWNTGIASMATNAVAECYRDGVCVSQDFEKTEKHFREVLAFGKERGNESATEFLSGKWKEVPTEGLAEWHEEKIGECIKKLTDVFFLSVRDWILAESDEEIKCAAENFSPEKVYDRVCSEIEDAARFAETHLGIEEAKEKIDQRMRGELSRLKKALGEWKDVLMEHLSILEQKEILPADWKRDQLLPLFRAFSEGATLTSNDSIAGGVKVIHVVMDEYRKEKGIEAREWYLFNEKENDPNSRAYQLSQKVGKAAAGLNDAEVALRTAYADVLFNFLQRNPKERLKKTAQRFFAIGAWRI